MSSLLLDPQDYYSGSRSQLASGRSIGLLQPTLLDPQAYYSQRCSQRCRVRTERIKPCSSIEGLLQPTFEASVPVQVYYKPITRSPSLLRSTVGAYSQRSKRCKLHVPSGVYVQAYPSLLQPTVGAYSQRIDLQAAFDSHCRVIEFDSHGNISLNQVIEPTVTVRG